jgi:hypothetical protein
MDNLNQRCIEAGTGEDVPPDELKSSNLLENTKGILFPATPSSLVVETKVDVSGRAPDSLYVC